MGGGKTYSCPPTSESRGQYPPAPHSYAFPTLYTLDEKGAKRFSVFSLGAQARQLSAKFVESNVTDYNMHIIP